MVEMMALVLFINIGGFEYHKPLPTSTVSHTLNGVSVQNDIFTKNCLNLTNIKHYLSKHPVIFLLFIKVCLCMMQQTVFLCLKRHSLVINNNH